MQRNLRWLLMILFPLFLMACALSEMGAQAGPTQAAPLATNLAAQPGDLSLDPGTTGLATYRVQMLVRFAGQDEQGQTFQSALTLGEEYDQAQAAQHLLAKTEMSDQPPASFELYRLGGQVYLVSTEISSQAGCLRLGVDESGTQPALRPKDIFTFIRRGDLVQSGEVVNGISADHYRLSEAGLGIGAAQGWSGDVWVAQQGGFVVRFTGSAEGQVTLTGRPGTGRLEWDYQLSAESPVTIALPEDCSALGLEDLPLPDGAQNVLQKGAQISFTSPSEAIVLVEYFRSALPERGWTIDAEAGAGTFFTLNASKESRALQIEISAQEQGCQVTINQK